MTVKEAENGKRAMALLTDNETEILEQAVKLVDPRIGISEIDYAGGTITLSYLYNVGTEHEWTDGLFRTVNVGADSRAAIVKDVMEKVFKIL